MNPTARWFFRGVWKLTATVVLTLLVFWVIGLIVRAVIGSDGADVVYPG